MSSHIRRVKPGSLARILLREHKWLPPVARLEVSRRQFAALDRRLMPAIAAMRQHMTEAIGPLNLAQVADAAPVTFSITADPRYAEQFLAPYAASVRRFGAPSIHLHLIGDPAAVGPDLRRTLAELSTCSWFGLSWEKTVLDGLPSGETGRYCQCIRFARAAQLMAVRPGQRLVVTDIDVLLLRELQPVLAGIVQPVAVRLRLRERFIGKRFDAGCVILDGSAVSHNYLAHAAARMLAHITHGYLIEKLDQSALYLSLVELGLLGSVHRLPEEVLSTDPGRAFLYTAKGSRKFQDFGAIFDAQVGSRQGEPGRTPGPACGIAGN